MEMHMHRLLRTGLLTIVFVILMATAYLAGVGNVQSLRTDAYNIGYEAAIEERGLAPVVDIRAEETLQQIPVPGVVQSVTADTLTITEEVPGSTEPGATRRVELAEGFVVGMVIGVEAKDPAVLERELAAYNRARQGNPNDATPLPAPDEQTEIALTDLRPGDRVTVMTFDPDADPIVAYRIMRTASAPVTAPEAATTTP